jgi:hypothetical protein
MIVNILFSRASAQDFSAQPGLAFLSLIPDFASIRTLPERTSPHV